RVTPFGKFLRRSRLDEFPQFVNILKGDMSLIGPRPERPYFVKELSQVFPFYETRHIIRPGLTGWAQVKVRYGSTVEDSLLKLQYDLYYIKHRSFFLDANVIVKTLSTMLFYRGQSGVLGFRFAVVGCPLSVLVCLLSVFCCRLAVFCFLFSVNFGM